MERSCSFAGNQSSVRVDASEFGEVIKELEREGLVVVIGERDRRVIRELKGLDKFYSTDFTYSRLLREICVSVMSKTVPGLTPRILVPESSTSWSVFCIVGSCVFLAGVQYVAIWLIRWTRIASCNRRRLRFSDNKCISVV
jgi:hypothetical protein